MESEECTWPDLLGDQRCSRSAVASIESEAQRQPQVQREQHLHRKLVAKPIILGLALHSATFYYGISANGTVTFKCFCCVERRILWFDRQVAMAEQIEVFGAVGKQYLGELGE